MVQRQVFRLSRQGQEKRQLITAAVRLLYHFLKILQGLREKRGGELGVLFPCGPLFQQSSHPVSHQGAHQGDTAVEEGGAVEQ